MKKILSVLMALIMALSAVQCLSVVSFAADESETAVAEDHGEVVKSGNCGPYNDETYDYNSNVTYTLYDDGQLVIGGSGAMADFYWNSEFPDTPYASYYFDEDDNVTDTTVKSVVIEDGVTHIGKNAFSGFAKLESAVIPDSVETIGESAFANSGIIEINALKNVRFIDSNAFVNCNGISAIIIDNPECELNQCGFPPLTEIHGYKYTPAYDYAVENGNSFVQIGEAKELESISISSMPYKTTYKQGSSFRQDGLIVTLRFTDGTSVDKTRGFTVSGFDSSEIGICTLTVTYEDKTAEFDVEIKENKEYVINSGETIQVDVESDSITYIKFVPTIDGTFTFTPYDEGEMPYAYLYDADKNTLVYGYDSEPITFNFETGKTYYWGVSCCEVGYHSIDVNLTCDKVICAHENTTEYDEQPATCTADGYTAGVQCNDCEKWLSGHALVLRHHTDEDGDRICDICGKEAKVIVKNGNCGASVYDEWHENIKGNEDNAQFVLYDDGTLFISGSGSIGRFDYGMYDEWPRVPYASYAYNNPYAEYYDSTVKSVIIEDGITDIGDNAFYCFLGLESIAIPDSVTGIGGNAFYECNSLKEVNFTGTQEQWENISVEWNNSALYNAEICYDYVLCNHNTITNHAEQAETCTEDGYTAGIYCEDCGKWIFGHAVIRKHHTDKDADNICDLCGEAARIAVKSGNCGASIYDEWSDDIVGNEDNAQFVLYDDGTLVISGSGSLGGFGYGMDGEWPRVPYASYSFDDDEYWETYFDDTVKSVIIEDGITAIGDYAFYHFRSLESVSIPESVETINFYAFGYSGIKEIVLPASVYSVGSSAFRNCDSLSKITINNPECDVFNSYIPSETEIHGYKYSTAYDYAAENGNNFVEIGESKELESISISSMPNKTTYKQGALFKKNGLAVTLNFSDGTTAEKTRGFTVSGFDSSEIGTCTVTVTYADKSTTFDVEIIEYIEPTINAGETITADYDFGRTIYIKFVPDVSGTYIFSVVSDDYETYYTLYSSDKETEITESDGNYIIADLEAGETYYWGLSWYYDSGIETVDVSLECVKVFCDHNHTVDSPEQPATCTAEGYTAGAFCEDCQTWASGHEIIFRHHTDEDNDGICDVCNKTAKAVVRSGYCGTYNRYTFDYNSNVVYILYDDGELVISGSGAMADFNWNSEFLDTPYASYMYDDMDMAIADMTVSSVVIENGVTRIGKNAFNAFKNLESVVIPESVTSIGNSAFYECSSLSEVNFTGTQEQWNDISVESYNSCLFDAEICYNYVPCAHNNTTNHPEQPATCTEDGITAGTYCEDCERWISGHKKIVKYHVDEDGDGICDVCKDEFKTVIKQGNCGAPIYDEDDEIVGYEDVNYDLYDNGLLVISGEGEMYNYSFHGYAPYADYQYDDISGVDYDNTVKAVVIENGVTSVGEHAFSGFRSLSSVTIPESVTRIGDYAFSGCTALDNVNIPDSVGSIGEGALTKELSFVPATAYAFHEGVSDGYYDIDDDESYYYYSYPDFENGDKLTVRNIDGTETEYTLTDGYFEAENAERIDAGHLSFQNNQYQNHWLPDGENNYLTICFGSAFCTVPVTVYDNPVESISVTLASPYVLMDRISSDETVHFRTGDVLTVNYTDGTSKEFICKVDKYNDYTFTSSDGEKLNRVRINRDGDFSVGMNTVTVSYAGKTCDFPVEVTQCTVESISASYRYTLYNGYDCQLDTCEEHDEWCSSEEYINDAYVLYSVNMTDGNVFTGTETEVYEKFGARPWTHIVLDRIGTNEGSVTLGDFIGTFTVNVEEKPSGEENLPTCYVNGFDLSYVVGQKVDYQLIQFADKGYTHSVNVISIPDGLTLSQDGRLTGTVTGRNSLEFDVRWDDTYVHEHYIGTINIHDASAKVEIPEVDDLTDYETRIYVKASESNPTWLKFRACNSGLCLCAFANDSYHRGYACEVYTENGVPLFPGAGDGGDYATALYSLAIGEYYYIKVNFSGWIKLEAPSWLPVWGEDDNLGGKMNYSLAETNVEKEFDGDNNTLWNVYKLEMPFHVDTNGGITYDIFGAMARFASPVNIHITSEATSNLEILNKKSYKFDPNSVEECEAIGASTEQDTLIDKLLPGEKEYRFDTVYYLMPEVADFDLVQTSLLYVPVGYALTDDDGIGRITESCTHGNTKTVTENEVPATCKEGGSYDSVVYCSVCHIEISREAKTTDKLGHSFTNYVSNNDATCTADGTKTAKCDRCDETDTVAETGSKKAHTETSIPAVSATCTEKGLTVGKKCSVCGEILVAQKEIPAKGHTPGAWIIDADSDCTNGGTKHQVCSVCGATTATQTIAAKGHTYEAVVTAPTCTADGYTTHTCSVCGNAYTDSVVKAKGHTEKTAVTKATTSKNGKIVTTCAVCGESLGTTVIYKASSIKLSATKYTYDGKTKTPTVTVKDSKGNTLKKGTDYTVKYATGRKNTGKYTVTVTFNGNYTGSKTLSFNILPGKTSKLTATQTTSSVKATWKSVTGASGYKVTLYSAKNKAIKTVYTTKTSASFTKLSKGTTYKVKVTAYKTIDGKKVTSSVSTLLTTATKPGTPTLKATAGTKKAALSWNKQTGAAGYVVYMSTSKFGKYTKIATVKGGSKVSFTKTGLTKGKTYYFKVAAFETVGGKTIYGGYSAVKSVKVK